MGQDVASRPARGSSPTTWTAPGLTPYLEKLGFSLVGYGCTTCIGNSGPLPDEVAKRVDEEQPERGRRPVRQPELRGPDPPAGPRELPGVAAARASRTRSPEAINFDLTTEPLGEGADGPVFLRDLWPSPQEVAEVIATAVDRRAVRRAVRPDLGGRRSLARRSRRRPGRRTSGIRTRPTSANRPSSRSGRRPGRRRRGGGDPCRRRADPREGRRLHHHRPHLARRGDPARTHPRVGTSSNDGVVASATSTPTGRDAGTTR